MLIFTIFWQTVFIALHHNQVGQARCSLICCVCQLGDSWWHRMWMLILCHLFIDKPTYLQDEGLRCPKTIQWLWVVEERAWERQQGIIALISDLFWIRTVFAFCSRQSCTKLADSKWQIAPVRWENNYSNDCMKCTGTFLKECCACNAVWLPCHIREWATTIFSAGVV